MSRAGSKTRLACKVALCAVGSGVFVTTLVAFLCLLYSPNGNQLEDHGGLSSEESKGQATGSVRFKHGALRGSFGYREWVNYWIWVPPPGARPSMPNSVYAQVTGAGVQEVRCGWPLVAFATSRDRFPEVCSDGPTWEAAVEVAYSRRTVAEMLPSFVHARPYRHWPTMPVTAGLVVDSVIYGGLISGLVFGVPAVRRLMRRRGGRCETCGYAVAGFARCPECGVELVRPSGAGVNKEGIPGACSPSLAALPATIVRPPGERAAALSEVVA